MARAGRFTKSVIAADIQKFMRKKKLIGPRCTITIPEGGYDYVSRETDDFEETNWTGNFEVFKPDMNTIVGYGAFMANVPVPANTRTNYSLVIRWKKKEHWIWD